MEDNSVDGLTESSVRAAYVSEFHRFLQIKAGTKPVSSDYPEQIARKLDNRDKSGANFWTKLLGYCISHSLEPVRLAKAFFSSKHNSNSMLIKPDGIFHSAVLGVYNQLSPGVDHCAERLRLQKANLVNHMERQWYVSGTPRETSAKLAMLVITSSYCALFRYCTLAQLGCDPSPWLMAALRQYKPDMASYDKAWGDFIPDTIRTMARTRRASA